MNKNRINVNILYWIMIPIMLLGIPLSSSAFLITGSDAAENLYSMPFYSKFSLLIIYLVMMFIRIKYKEFLLLILLILSVISSQTIVSSGKKNAIIYYIYGIEINRINYDPTGRFHLEVIGSLITTHIVDHTSKQSITYISLPLILQLQPNLPFKVDKQ